MCIYFSKPTGSLPRVKPSEPKFSPTCQSFAGLEIIGKLTPAKEGDKVGKLANPRTKKGHNLLKCFLKNIGQSQSLSKSLTTTGKQKSDYHYQI